MAEGIVDGLEVVEVDEEEGAALAGVLVGFRAASDAVEEELAVGDAGEGVVESQGLDALPGGFDVRDVAGDGDDAGDAFDFESGGGHHAREDFAVFPAESGFEILADGVALDGLHEPRTVLRIGPDSEFEGSVADEFFAGIAGGSDEGVVDIEIGTVVGAVDGDAVGAGFEDAAVAALADAEFVEGEGEFRFGGSAFLDIFDEGDDVERGAVRAALG